MIVKKGIENADCKIKSEDELMNKSDFNLIEEQWIPVAQIGLVSLRDIFSNPDLPALGGSVLEKIAVMKLLLAIAQASYTPRDNKDWLELGISGLKEKCLSYLEQQKPYFSLYGEHPFLQFTQVKKAEIKPYSILFPEIASGNTSLLFHSQVAPAITDLDDAKKALALLVQMSSCFSGKKVDASVVLSPGYVKSKSAKSGPALCSLGLLHSFFTGENILDTIWFNLLTSQDISHDRTFINGIGTPPWEKMPAGEEQVVTADTLQSTLTQYQSDVMTNLQNILGKWGISDISSLFSPSSSDPLGLSDADTSLTTDSYDGSDDDSYTDSYEDENDTL